MDLSFIVWNTQRKALYQEITAIAHQHDAEFLILIESSADPSQLLAQLSLTTKKQNDYSVIVTKPIRAIFLFLRKWYRSLVHALSEFVEEQAFPLGVLTGICLSPIVIIPLMLLLQWLLSILSKHL